MRRALFALALAACGNDANNKTSIDAGSTTDTSTTDSGGNPSTCGRMLAPDGARHIVVAKPYTADSNPANTYEVLDVSATGAVSRHATPLTFDLHRASFGAIAFTPDGKVGMVPQSDGTLGVFGLAADGTPTVISAGFGMGMFYASRVVIDPSGDYAYVVDSDTMGNGGGVYALKIGCDGMPSLIGKVAAASTPNGLILDGNRAFVVAGQSVLDAPASNEAVMVTWGATPAVTASANAFGTGEAIVGGSALSADKKTLFIGDTNSFSGIPNRVAVVGVGADSLVAETILTPIADPEAIVASPFGNVALVTSTADGDAIVILDDGGTNHAWRVRGNVTYSGAGPMLPGDMAAITRGALEGHVYVGELSSIRHLAFDDNGNVTDLGSVQFGDGIDQILGAIGITP